MTFHDTNLIKGSGGGGGKGKGGGGSDAENTLRSKARARFVELISEGPCEGLVGGAKGLFFEQTPVQNADGSYNFDNVVWEQRLGQPDQAHLNGFPTVETMHSVEVEVKNATGPVQRTINEENADAVRVIVRLPALAKQSKKDGSVKPTSVSYQIEVRGYNGTWQVAHVEDLKNQKTTSAVQRAHRIELPLGGSPWDIRVRRNTADSEDERLANETWWESYTVLVEGKFTYPHTALVAQQVNAEDMGSTIPARSYRWRGLKTLVPSNYNPLTRTYTGLWNGTFKTAWHSNPVWVFHDLLVNDRYGLGEFVNPAIIDKWSLYAISQYCDEMIPSGFKNADTGEDILEPRYSFNGVINSRDDAYKVLQQITTTWRGMAFWSLGKVWATADMPADPIKLVTPANTINGEFTYSGTAMKARHSVALVTWTNPDDFYGAAVEVVINDEMLRRYGWREKKVDLVGCTSRGLAHRYGKWVLDIEQHETETIDYVASWDHADVRPGHIIAVADPHKAQVRIGGRLAQASTSYVILDHPFVPVAGEAYSIYCTLPSGEVVKRDIAGFANIATDKDGNEGYLRVNLVTALPASPAVNSVWVITGTDVQPRQYRVIAVSEEEKNKFHVTALFHDPSKYARVEEGITLEPLPYTRPKTRGEPPINLRVTEQAYLVNGQNRSTVAFSWENPQDFMTREYEVAVLSPSRGYYVLGNTSMTAIDIENLEPGEYKFYVAAISYVEGRSRQAEIAYEVVGWGASAVPVVTDLRLRDGAGSEFTGRDVRIQWENNFPGSIDPTSDDALPAGITSPFYSHNIVKVYDVTSGDLLRQQRVTSTSFTYSFEMNRSDNQALGRSAQRALRFEVTLFDTMARESVPVSLSVSNPTPAAFNPSVVVNGKTLHMRWSAPDDTDIAGVMIWASKISGFDPYLTNPIFDGTGSFTSFVGDPNTTYYVRAAAYDSFGKVGLNISPEMSVVTMAEIDFDPPATPTGLTVTSTLQADGKALLVADWDDNSESDLAYYDVRIKQGTGNWISFQTSTSRYEWTVQAGTSWAINVRAVDQLGNASGFTADVAHVAAKDTTAPAVPTGLAAKGGFGVVWLTFNKNAESDLRHYEIYESATTTAPVAATAATYATLSETFVRSGLSGVLTRYYWVRAVDTSGNKSAWSARVSATTIDIDATISTEDLQGLVDATSFAAGITAPGIGATLPATPFTATTPKTFYLTTDKSNYIQKTDGSGWIKETDASLIVGQLVAGQIAAGAIGTQQLAAKAVTAEKMVLGDFTNRVENPHFGEGDVGWVKGPNVVITNNPSGAYASDYYAIIQTGAAGIALRSGNIFPVVPGEQYTLKAVARASGSPNAALTARIRFMEADKSTFVGAVQTGSFTSTTYEEKISSGVVPAGAVFAWVDFSLTAALTTGAYAVGYAYAQRRDAAELIVDGSIKANHLTTGELITASAQIKDAVITSAKIVELDAAKLKAGTAIAATITVSGTALSTVRSNAALGAQDPADRINAGSTQIDPGKIVVSGTTTLADWRKGGDETRIDGGALSANTVTANKLEIGSRNITLEGIVFEHNKPATNQASWTAGSVRYINDAGSIVSKAITAGNTTVWSSGVMYIYWAKDATTFSVTTSATTAFAVNNVVMATYRGGVDLDPDYGRTIIDGSTIKTGTVTTSQLKADSVTSAIIAANAVQAEHVGANQINAKHMVLEDGTNLVQNGTFADITKSTMDALWDFRNGVYTQTASATGISAGGFRYATGTSWVQTGQASLVIDKLAVNPALSLYMDSKAQIPVTAGDVLYWETEIRSDVAADGGFYFILNWYDANGTALTSPANTYVASNQPVTTTFTIKSGKVTVPAAACFCKIRIYNHTNNTTARFFVLDRVVLRRANAASLIVDGSIKANHIDVSTLSAISADVGTVTAGMLKSSDSKMQIDLTNKRILIQD